jgi:glycosyltransferase involved in cell wall biosynthesis
MSRLGPERVLLAYRSDVDRVGGAGLMMDDLAEALTALGLHVDVTLDQHPDVSGYDLVHAMNIWSPDTALDQLRYLRAQDVPVAWTPIYSHWAEVAWARPAVQGIYSLPDGDERRGYLQAFAAGNLDLPNGMTRWRFNEIHPNFHELLRQMIDCADHMLAFSHNEMQLLAQVTRVTQLSYSIVPHGVVGDLVQAATPDAFRERLGTDEPFVLSVGTLNGHKNQLLLIEALKGTGLKLVLIGGAREPEYHELVIREGGDQLVHFDHLPRELVASAYQAAAVHAQTSFADCCAQVNLEAAIAGCPIVVSNRRSEFEYYGDLAYYCDPSDPDSIRRAVVEAFDGRRREPARWQACSERIAEHTWERAAQAVLAGYERTIERHTRSASLRAREAAGIRDVRATTVLSLLDELESEPRLLTEYAARVDEDAPVTLLVCAIGADDNELAERAGALIAAADLPARGADMVAFSLEQDQVEALTRAVDHTYGSQAAALVPTASPFQLA